MSSTCPLDEANVISQTLQALPRSLSPDGSSLGSQPLPVGFHCRSPAPPRTFCLLSLVRARSAPMSWPAATSLLPARSSPPRKRGLPSSIRHVLPPQARLLWATSRVSIRLCKRKASITGIFRCRSLLRLANVSVSILEQSSLTRSIGFSSVLPILPLGPLCSARLRARSTIHARSSSLCERRSDRAICLARGLWQFLLS